MNLSDELKEFLGDTRDDSGVLFVSLHGVSLSSASVAVGEDGRVEPSKGLTQVGFDLPLEDLLLVCLISIRSIKTTAFGQQLISCIYLKGFSHSSRIDELNNHHQ